MFKSYRNFTLDKTNTKRLKIRKTRKGDVRYTLVQLHDTVVVRRQNINNVVTLNSGGWKTNSTKTVINTALKLIYGNEAPIISQINFKWYITGVEYFDGMMIGGGNGAKFIVMN